MVILKWSEPGMSETWFLKESTESASGDNIQTLELAVGQSLQEVTTKPCPTNLENIELDSVAEISCEGSVRNYNS